MRSMACLACMVLFATTAAAEVVVFDYQAVLEDAVDPAFASIANQGDPVSGRLIYDTSTSDSNPLPSQGLYLLGVTHSFTFGSFSGTSTGGFLRIFNDGSIPAFDGFQVIDFSPGEEVGEIGGLPVTRVTFVMNGSTDLYASDALPSAPPEITDPLLFETSVALAVTSPETGSTSLIATITAVPEPDHGAAIAAAVLGVLATVRRRGHRDYTRGR